MNNSASNDLRQKLLNAGIQPTRQRLRIASTLFEQHQHFSAQDLYDKVNDHQRSVCRATIYNTLHLFVHHGLVREIAVDGQQTFYDSNTDHPHHHIYDERTGTLIDIDPDQVSLHHMPKLQPLINEQDKISLLIRIHRN